MLHLKQTVPFSWEEFKQAVSPWSSMKYSDFDSDNLLLSTLSKALSLFRVPGIGPCCPLALALPLPSLGTGSVAWFAFPVLPGTCEVLVYACFCCSCLVLSNLFVNLSVDQEFS